MLLDIEYRRIFVFRFRFLSRYDVLHFQCSEHTIEGIYSHFFVFFSSSIFILLLSHTASVVRHSLMMWKVWEFCIDHENSILLTKNALLPTELRTTMTLNFVKKNYICVCDWLIKSSGANSLYFDPKLNMCILDILFEALISTSTGSLMANLVRVIITTDIRKAYAVISHHITWIPLQ